MPVGDGREQIRFDEDDVWKGEGRERERDEFGVTETKMAAAVCM